MGDKKNRFSFITSDSGKYEICLITQTSNIEFKLKLGTGVELTIDTNDHNKERLNDKLKAFERTTEILKNHTTNLMIEMQTLRKSGNEQGSLNRATTKNVIIFGGISVIIIIVSAVVQICYLKRFFRQKKIV